MIPLRVTPGFFITAAIIGFINSFSLIGTLVWMIIIFVSVLVHEYGHALTSKLFGQHPQIELIFFGGVTIPKGHKLKLWQEFIVVLMGPVFGFLLFALAFTILKTVTIQSIFVRSFLQIVSFVNLFWTIINLLPIMPLDGGQLMRIVLEAFLKDKAWKVSQYISLGFAVLGSLLFFALGLFLVGAIFVLFAFQSIEMIRRFHHYSSVDQDTNLQDLLKEAEYALHKGDIQTASAKLQEVIDHTKHGILFTGASEMLANIDFEKRHYQEAYQRLKPLEKDLSPEAKYILYSAAFEVGDYEKVIALSGICFQEQQTPDIAIKTAIAQAHHKDVKKSIEWLKTAHAFKDIDLFHVLEHPGFEPILGDETFQVFKKSLEKNQSS